MLHFNPAAFPCRPFTFPDGPSLFNKKASGIPPGAFYIGRPSKWGNPFVLGKDGSREEVVARYERHLHESGLIGQVHELRGTSLVCWCAPLLCHGHVLLWHANPDLTASF